MNHFDHSGHEGMDHGGMGHGGHDGMDMGGMCSMQMLWNTQIIDTCIVFPGWHIRSHFSFVLSFFAIVALGVFYEWLRAFTRRVDRSVARSLAAQRRGKQLSTSASAVGPGSVSLGDRDDVDEVEGLLTGRSAGSFYKANLAAVPPYARLLRAALYASTVFLSFFLMLVFMTYNAYLILAVVLGAGIGHYYLGGQMDLDSTGSEDKGMACH